MNITAILIDSREPEWVKKLTFSGVPVSIATLDAGDIWVATADNHMIVIERKTPNDFLGSLKDERLFVQVAHLAKLRELGYWPYVMVTGPFLNLNGNVFTDRETGFTWNSVEGALLTIQEMGVFVTSCAGDTDLEAAVIRLADRKREDKLIIPPARLGKVLGIHAGFLCGLPGIGPEKVTEILNYCGNPAQALVGLTDNRIPIPGIGPGIRNNVRYCLGLKDDQQIEIVLNDQDQEVLAIYDKQGEVTK